MAVVISYTPGEQRSYEGAFWKNDVAGGTAITAGRLNNIEKGIVDCVTQINANSESIEEMGSSVIPIERGGTGETSASDAWTALGGGSIGKKSSLVAADIPNISAAKITTGTLEVARGGTGAATSAANRVFAGPSSGAAAAPSFRALVAADIPTLAIGTKTSGTLAVGRGGTGATTASANRVFAGPASGDAAAPSFRVLKAADLPTDLTETESVVSKIIAANSSVTISEASYSRWGKIACCSVTFTPKSSWAADAQLAIGTVVTGKRPSVQVGGGASGITAGLSTAGSVYARNNTGAARTASTTLAFLYIVK